MTPKKLFVILSLLAIFALLCSCSTSSLNDLFSNGEDTHEHSYYDATCTTPKTCKICEATLGSAKGHSWLEATCNAPKICANCNETVGEKLGHDWQEATNTTPKTCSRCGETDGDPLDVEIDENYHGKIYTGGSGSTRYHYEPNCAGKYSHEITWEDVEANGLIPCGTCVAK